MVYTTVGLTAREAAYLLLTQGVASNACTSD